MFTFWLYKEKDMYVYHKSTETSQTFITVLKVVISISVWFSSGLAKIAINFTLKVMPRSAFEQLNCSKNVRHLEKVSSISMVLIFAEIDFIKRE
jgi:hypothetical protein